MHHLLLAPAIIVSLLGCVALPSWGGTSSVFDRRLVLTLATLDDRPLPVRYVDTLGDGTLLAGQLTLDPDGRLWLTLDVRSDVDSVGELRHTLISSYRRIGADSVEFPSIDDDGIPEFFGRWNGLDLILVTRPDSAAGLRGIARDYGAHVWRFRR